VSVNILRWRPGAGGDMILYYKSLCSPGSVINVDYIGIENGRTMVDIDKTLARLHSQIVKITEADQFNQVNQQLLLEEIHNIDSTLDVWLKSHYYDTVLLDSITVDIVASELTIPFMISAGVDKTFNNNIQYNKLMAMIKDPQIRINYALYVLAIEAINNRVSSQQKIYVDDIINGVDSFMRVTDQVGLHLDFDLRYIYVNWLENNKKYLPSDQYQRMVADKDYDWSDTELSLAERYTLLALSGDKFRNLS
jgi:hypothetical protein